MQYSLRQMVDITGLTEFTLRGWELRYGAFRPSRTDTGRRQYSPRDLEKALLLRELAKRDFRIGDIAPLKLHRLRHMMVPQTNTTSNTPSRFNSEVQSIMKHVSLQHWVLLESELSSLFKRLKPLCVVRDFVIPIFEQMGFEVASGRLSVSQEHILSAMLKQHLHQLVLPFKKDSSFKVVIAGPEGDFHELGILAAQVITSQLKVPALFIGPNTPKHQLCETASRFGATHLILGSTVSKEEGAKEDFYSYVHFLDQNLSKQVAFWLGGRASRPVTLKREVLQIKSLLDLEKNLVSIKKIRRTD